MLAAAIALVACSDPTAPGGKLEVVIAPDMLRSQVFDAAPFDVRVRNGLPYPVRFDRMPAVIQTERTPGVWENVDNVGAVYYLLTSSLTDVAANEEQSSPEFRAAVGGFPDLRAMAPGRYRVGYQFTRIEASGGTAPSSWTIVYSNAVTVTP